MTSPAICENRAEARILAQRSAGLAIANSLLVSRKFLFVAVLATASACGFTAPSGNAGNPGPDAAGSAAQPDAPAEPPPGFASQCNPADNELRLCMDFEQPNQLGDDSIYKHSTQAQNVVIRGAGQRPGNAAYFNSTTSVLQVAESAMFDVPELTIMLWAQHTGTTEQFLVDNDNQYWLYYQADGRVRCAVADDYVDGPALDSAWHHVACTFDGDRIKLYVDGSVVDCTDTDASIDTSGTRGVQLGGKSQAGASPTSRLSGAIDFARLWGRALPGNFVCSAWNGGACDDRCPDQRGGGGGPGGR